MPKAPVRKGVVLRMWEKGPPHQRLPDCPQKESHEREATGVTCPASSGNQRRTPGQWHIDRPWRGGRKGGLSIWRRIGAKPVSNVFLCKTNLLYSKSRFP